ncbi:winged helix-turn-helix transcriptional regulator [Listeria booriae]|uniref:Helix-turn-helix transcriptional regulator n=1 Tax=Listeria booriae TaxID=1552123 RepID=A0A841YJS3_9LIST|nr:helix-turn-helix domain-containing protein [Listeria booriae]MBC1400480.1 helix-turn-helix transcriptional regulator [Listeria booriae]MBC1615794.1 helix-turn-helix transcriptional regulator [Listeria booriae]MBC2319302.1 helix-turn-helix transcriptional regulator [Listeria booriae]
MESVYGKCPYATTQRVLTGKWSIVVLYQLSTGTKRFNELQRLIPGITQTILTKQLRQLENDMLINRKIYAEVPPRVEYSLSDLGEKFKSVLEQIEVFGLEYISELKLKNGN